jgi:hypothetical protein
VRPRQPLRSKRQDNWAIRAILAWCEQPVAFGCFFADLQVLCRALGFPRNKLEVDHANQKRTPRSQLLSRSIASVGKASRPRLMSSAVIALWAVSKSYWRNSVAMIRVRADLVVDFKRCCMLSGEFDGSDRDYYSR